MSVISGAVRQAVRRLARAPLFTGLVILTLAPGIGAHVAIFSFVNVLFLKPLPLRDAGRVVGVYQTRQGTGYHPLSLPDYIDTRAASTVFDGLASHYPTSPLQLANGNESMEINGSVVSGNYFSVLGVEPALGRFFGPQDDAPGVSPVVVISHKMWQSRFAGRRDVLGQVLRMNNTAFTVVGVAPARFDGVLLGIPSDVWLPNSMAATGYRFCDARSRDCTWLNLIGRLKPGRTLDEAQAEMAVMGSRLAAAYPATNQGLGLRVAPLRGVHPSARADTLRLAALLLAAVTLVIAVACANAGSLLLMRSLTRRREIAVRLALGATRSSVVAPIMAEALLPALLGGAAGVLIAGWLGRVIVALYPSDVPLDLTIDLKVIGYAGLLSLLTGLIVGLVPALQSTRPSLVTAMKEDVTAAAHGRPRLLGLMIIIQAALSFVLLTCTGLLARSAANAVRGGGFDPAGVVTLRLRPRQIDYTPRQGQAFNREALRRLQGLPGIRAVSLAIQIPPAALGETVSVRLPGQAFRSKEGPTAQAGEIAPHFFQTLDVPFLQGRDFDDHDSVGTAPVAIINRTLAKRLWPDRDAIGQPIVIADKTADKTYTVVGLVADVGSLHARQEPAAQIYLPYWQNADLLDARLCLRADGDLARLLPAVRRELHAIDPNVPVTEMETLTATLDRDAAPIRATGTVLAAAAGLALVLSTIGLYGILSLAVAQRHRDIGIRMALGASRNQVVALVVRDAIRLVATALAIGLAVTLAVSRLLAHDLYGITARDPLTFTAALLLLTLTAALASWLPARRASRVDPVVAIRGAGSAS
ncbi:MAG TPA: ABC transporter permease [Thermoanaerobaculia bacterium]|jgi:predicted permease|nr:ABC transporter permease [Thermoanaerobaculia bacterium]